jgi:orotidine-5'-phosphate decarboxylase
MHPHSPRDAADPLRRIAVALDTDDLDQFESWCAFFGPRVGVLKVGLEAFVRWGPRAVEMAVARSRAVFLDLKLHDIPNTVHGAVRSAGDLGVRYLTVHAGGGDAMLEAAVQAGRGTVKLLAVTVLTHLEPAALERLNLPGSLPERAESWARLAQEAGCAGAVCSPHELPRLRPVLKPPFQLVTPGIRPRGASRDDQRRVATPAEALAQGADLMVIGRPLTRTEDPGQALGDLARELTSEAP